MQARFLLGPAGSGKTFRCLAEIRAELLKSADGLPLVLLAPKQATFQLERQLLAVGSLAGYTRLQILSFERLAEFVLAESSALPPLLDEEGRVMVLRALLARKQPELRVFRASARLPGFAQQLNLLLRELQRHQISPQKLLAVADKVHSPPHLGDKLHDLALLLRAYLDWLEQHRVQDAGRLLDLATQGLRSAARAARPALHLGGLWLDGFAEMTPQELDFLAALTPFCDRATLAFCLEDKPSDNESWLSPWSVVGRTFTQCHERLNVLPECELTVEILERTPERSRFADNAALAYLEQNWARPAPFSGDVRQTVRAAVCPSPEAEAVLAAREILRYVRAGGRYRDCAVLVRKLEAYADVLRRVFGRYEIPFFLDRREPVAHHPLAELTRYAVRLAAFGWEHDDWFGALKTGLVSNDEEAIDRLENEALARGWKGSAWWRPLEVAGDAELERSINRWMEDVLPPFRQWLDTAHGSGTRFTGAQLAGALRDLWGALNVEQTLETWSAEPDHPTRLPRSVHETVFDQMTAWLDNVERAFRDEPLGLVEWLPILEAGLAGLTVGVIPPALDQVLIGAIDRSRNPDLRLAVLPGWNEGIFPAKPADPSLLSPAEREALAAQNLALGPDQRQRLGHERYYAYIACSRARQRLVITCAARDAADSPLNPSLFIAHLQRLFPGLEPETVATGIDWREAEHGTDLVAPLLAGLTPDGSGATRNAVPASAVHAFESLPVFAAPVQKLRRLAAAGATSLPPALAESLYGRELRTSVGALEDFAACPFKFFAARGLRAGERETFEADPRARGDFQHRILEIFHREVEKAGRRWRDLSVEEARVLAGRIGDQLLPAYRDGLFLADDARHFSARLMIAGAQRLIETLVAWMPQYRFDPRFVEVTFGLDEQGLPPWRIELADDHALVLRGRIDRIDLCQPRGSGETLAVVIDYKSRPRNLDAVKLQHGLELQLLSYLGVLQHCSGDVNALHIPALVPAGVFYVSLKPRRGSGRTRTEARANSDPAIRSGFQHSGRFDAGRLDCFDNRGETKGDQFKYAVNKDGAFARRGNDALETTAFRRLLSGVADHLRRLGNAIYEGDVSVAPFRKGSETACDFCEFRAICRFDPWVQPYRLLRPIPRGGEGVGLQSR